MSSVDVDCACVIIYKTPGRGCAAITRSSPLCYHREGSRDISVHANIFFLGVHAKLPPSRQLFFRLLPRASFLHSRQRCSTEFSAQFGHGQGSSSELSCPIFVCIPKGGLRISRPTLMSVYNCSSNNKLQQRLAIRSHRRIDQR